MRRNHLASVPGHVVLILVLLLETGSVTLSTSARKSHQNEAAMGGVETSLPRGKPPPMYPQARIDGRFWKCFGAVFVSHGETDFSWENRKSIRQIPSKKGRSCALRIRVRRFVLLSSLFATGGVCGCIGWRETAADLTADYCGRQTGQVESDCQSLQTVLRDRGRGLHIY